MTRTQAAARVEKLKAEINKYRYQYHVLNNLEISEAALDSLKHELLKLEEQFPELTTPDSPTQRVAGEPRQGFKKIIHEVPQWSLEDIFNEDEAREFDARVRRILEKEHGVKTEKPDYVAELKIDGFHVVLTYKNGLLKSAATRGDGKVGEDITQNIKTIESVPLRLEEPLDIIVEGEVWMSRQELVRINKQREAAGEPPFANPRNCAAGSIRQLDPKIARQRKLDCFIYDIGQAIKEPETQEKELEYLKKLGFKVNKEYRHCGNITQAIEFWRDWQNKRDKQPYWIDGVVIKLNRRDWQTKLGYRGKSPRWACAFKFAAEQATTVVEDIFVSVGRMGTLTPIAYLKPVQVAGTTVSRASLHNEDIVKKLDVRKGDTVIIQKAGDIIPEVLKVLPEFRTGKEKPFHMPRKCPVCHASAKREPEESATYCQNPFCYAQQVAKIIHYAYAVEIMGLGEKIVEVLFDKKLIKDSADLYALQAKDLKAVERFADKSSAKLIEAIQSRKVISLAKFLFGLGIKHVGTETAYLLVKTLTDGRVDSSQISPDELVKRLSQTAVNDWQKVKGIGDKVAESLTTYFSNKEAVKFFEKFQKAGVRLVVEKSGGRLAGKSFVFTGGLTKLSREEAKGLVRKQGGDVSESVNKKTTFVVVGSEAGSKLDKAIKLGVRVLSERELLDMVG